jgi:hypothetical protein
LELVVRKDNTMKLFGKKAQPKKEEPKMQEAVLTLYACRKDVKTVPDLACRLFSEVMDKILYTDEDEFHIQFKDGTGVQFHLVTDAEETEVQSKGMAVCCCRLTERVILRSFIPRQAPRFWIGRRKKRRPTENGKCVPLPF